MYRVSSWWEKLELHHKLGLMGLILTVFFFVTLPFIAIDLEAILENLLEDYIGSFGMGGLFGFGGMDMGELRLSYLETMVNSGQLYRAMRAVIESLRQISDDVPTIHVWLLWMWTWFLRVNFLFFLVTYVAYLYRILLQGVIVGKKGVSWLKTFDQWVPLGIGATQFLSGLLFLLLFRTHAGSGLWLMWLSSGLWLGSGYLSWQGVQRDIEKKGPARRVYFLSYPGHPEPPQRRLKRENFSYPPISETIDVDVYEEPDVLKKAEDESSPADLNEKASWSYPASPPPASAPAPAPPTPRSKRDTAPLNALPEDKTIDMSDLDVAEPKPPKAWLQHRSGKRIELMGVEITIGRASSNTIRLTHPSVSKRHAKIIYHNGRYWLQDLRSTNGTEVNGKRIRGERVPLTNRAVIRFGLMDPIWFVIEE